jgi:hypothetical protein
VSAESPGVLTAEEPYLSRDPDDVHIFAEVDGGVCLAVAEGTGFAESLGGGLVRCHVPSIPS